MGKTVARCVVFLFRWFSGRELDGHRRTNATWRYVGTVIKTESGHASRWAHRTYAQRSLVRNAVALPVIGTAYGLIADYDATIATVRLVAIILLPVLVYYTWSQGRLWDHHRKTTIPIARSTAERAGHSPHADPHKWIIVPQGYRDDPSKEVKLTFGPQYSGGEAHQRATGKHVASKLGLVDPDISWDHEGNATLVIRARPAPPTLVTLEDVQSHLCKAVSGRPLLGLGPRTTPVHVDLDNESPHVLLSMSTGGGKSVLIQTIMMQELHLGALALVLDIKRVSHMWTKGLPNVEYARDIGAIHHALLWVGNEVQRRMRVTDEHTNVHGDISPGLVGPRLLIIVEEVNATMNALKSYWSEIRGQDDPRKSPAVTAFHDVLFMGRQGEMNVLAAGQLATAASLGGPDARENFATRILGRGSAKAWGMLAPEIKPIPKSSKVNGRVQVVCAGEATPCQVIKAEVAEAISYATSGTVASWADLPCGRPLVGWSPVGELVHDEHVSPGNHGLRLVHGTGESDAQDFDTDELVGLKYATEQGVLSCPLSVARRSSRDDPEFPKPVESKGAHKTAEKLYSASALRAWDRNSARSVSG